MSRIKDAFDAVAAAIIAQKDYLSDIDAKAGDGDHGFNMARGFRAAQEIVDEMEDTSQPGPVLKKIGKALQARFTVQLSSRLVKPVMKKPA